VLEADEATPKLQQAFGFNVVISDEGQIAVGADHVGRQGRRLGPRGVAVAYRQLQQVGDHQHASGGIDREGAWMKSVRVDRMEQFGFAAGLVDREYRDAVLTPGGVLLALALDQSAGSVADVDEPTVRMNVDRADPSARAAGCPARSEW
jgi:hypothetical protein